MDGDAIRGVRVALADPRCSHFMDRPLGVFNESAGGAATSGGAGMSPDVHAAAVLSAMTATRIENRLTARCMRLLVYWFRKAVSSHIHRGDLVA